MPDYSDCYAALGLTHDTDWETLRAHYRRLIGQWHPDRFSADAGRKDLAEERSKQITLAYQALEKYRRAHGVLPPMEPAASAVGAQRPTRDPSPVSVRASSKVHAETHAKGGTVREPALKRRRRAAIALPALIAGLYVAYLWAPDDTADSADSPGAATPAPVAENPPDAGGISTGSTLGEVYAIQGIPTLTEGDTWHYGKSRIRFAQGKVISWKEHPDNPLHISRDQFVQLQDRYFEVGSSKDDVRAIQGPPVTETDTVWDYAPSRVYFEQNRVARWTESPLQPLRVRR